MDSDEFDMGDASASPDKLDVLNSAVEEAVSLQEAIDQMESDLKAAKKAVHTLKSARIPDLMDEAGVDQLTFRGWKVTVQDFVSGSLPKDPDRRAEAIGWLEQNGGEGLIKTNLSLVFGRSQHNEAHHVASQLREQGLEPEVDSGVHAQTLQAFARERIRNGESIDPDKLGLYVGKAAKLQRSSK